MTLPQDTIPPELERMRSEMGAAVRAHWKAFLIEGILLAVLGLLAMILTPLASLAVTIFLGWMFLISGIAGLALTFWARGMPGFWWSLLSAALAIIAGFILVAQPVQGTVTLTVVIGVYFLAEGVASILYAFEHGVVTQASLMVNGASAVTAVAKAKRASLPLGLHLNLSEGRPLSPPDSRTR